MPNHCGRIGPCLAVISCAVGGLAAGGDVRGASAHDARPLMGTRVEVVAEADTGTRARAALEAGYREMRRLAAMLSHYEPGSAVSALNAMAGQRAVPVPREVMDVLVMARNVSDATAGAFDVTVGGLDGWRFGTEGSRVASPAEIAAALPRVDYRRLRLDRRRGTAMLDVPGSRVDPGGIAKLYIIDAGLRAIRRAGGTRAMVNGGGDVVAFGGSGARPWRIGLRDPRAPDAVLGVLPLADGVVASSGDYARGFDRDGHRFHHILDPRTGEPTRGPRGVTLVAPRLEDVNGYTVAIMVQGRDAGIRRITGTPGLEGLVVGADGALWMSPGLRARLEPPPR